MHPTPCPLRVTKANPKGTLPIIKDRSQDQFIVDSDTISGKPKCLL